MFSTTAENKKLLCLQCPFTWSINESDRGRCVLFKMMENLEDHDVNYCFQNFIFYILCCYLGVRKLGVEKGFAILVQYADRYRRVVTDRRMRQYRTAFAHVFHSTLAYILVYMKKEPESKMVLEKVSNSSDFDKKTWAAIYAIQGALLQSLSTNLAKSIELSQKALELDPQQSEWLFLLGTGLQRLRRFTQKYSAVSEMEMQCLEKALDGNPRSALYMVMLARSYCEAVTHLFYEHRPVRGPLKDILDTVSDVIEQLLRLAQLKDGNSWHILFRCGFVYLKMPGDRKNVCEATRCLERALAMRPNDSGILHRLAIATSITGRSTMAAQYIEPTAMQTNVYGAFLDYVRFTIMQHSKIFDPIPLLDEHRHRFTTDEQADLLCQKATYLLTSHKKIDEAIELYYEAMKMVGNPYVLKNLLPIIASQFVKLDPSYRLFCVYQLVASLLPKVTDTKMAQDISAIVQAIYPNGFDRKRNGTLKKILDIVEKECD